MPNAVMGRRLVLFGVLVVGSMATQDARAQVFLKCTFFNGRVERLKIDPGAKKAAILEGGTFALEVSESFYTLTIVYDFGASGGGVVDIETRIDRRSELLTTTIAGVNKGNFAPYPLAGMCSDDRPWPRAVF
jgi:hypothetical protein